MSDELTQAIERLEHECLITAEPDSGLAKDIKLVCAAVKERGEDTKLTHEQRMLYDLLAVIHGDGGHYRAEHGTEKAFENAITKVVNLALHQQSGDKP